jgi:hypothetical protein
MESSPSQPNQKTSSNEEEKAGLLPYHAPVLKSYGGLAELVRHNPGTGADGSSIVDCTHS